MSILIICFWKKKIRQCFVKPKAITVTDECSLANVPFEGLLFLQNLLLILYIYL